MPTRTNCRQSSTRQSPKSARSAGRKATPTKPDARGARHQYFVSALIAPSGCPAAIYSAWQDDTFTLLTCVEQLDELRATLEKPKVAALVKPSKAGRLVNLIRKFAEDAGPLPRVTRSPDPADDFLLALAVLTSN